MRDRAGEGTTVNELLKAGTKQLAGLGDSPRLDAELLLAHALGQNREGLYKSLFTAVPAEQAARYATLLADRRARQPVAQLVGHREFWSLELEVTRGTLVPRPETELLVERALERVPTDATVAIADLGTGTGAVALAIARERPGCKVTGTDLSKPALGVARRNAKTLQIRNARFKQGHWFEAVPKARFALITSNPPYIADDEWSSCDPELAFEPRLALAGGRDGLDALRVIVGEAPGHLQPGGWLLLEHGATQGDAVRALLKAAGFVERRTWPDLAGNPRVSEGRLPE